MTPPAIIGTLESALYASNLSATVAFYHGILGLPVIGRPTERDVFFRVGASVLLIFDPALSELRGNAGPLPVPPHGARGPGHYCFAVDKSVLDQWRSHLEAKGIAIEADFHWSGGARSLYVRDPAGNSIEFADKGLWTGA